MTEPNVIETQRDIDLHLVANTIGGPILISRHKLGQYIADARQELQRDSFDEWFEWLADRVADLEQGESRSPAHIREAGWKP